MTELALAPNLYSALKKFRQIVKAHAENGGKEGKRLVVFCEDRLSLVAERAVCEETGGTFSVSVYTFSRFLAAEDGEEEKGEVLSGRGSAMAVSRLIERNREKLQLFNRLASAGAAQEVYDTIALLYSSKISPDDIKGARTENKLLARKLHDLEFLYREYKDYLKDSGCIDRNAYLRRLPSAIRRSERLAGADAAIFGYQAFTASSADAVRAVADAADGLYGIFIGGEESKYVNEAWAVFDRICVDSGRDIKRYKIPSALPPAAEQLRSRMLEPESFYSASPLALTGDEVTCAECADEDEECLLFAAAILKCVYEGGLRYREISVMLPDLNSYQPILERVFGEYGIPYYVDRRYPLSSHFICDFIVNYLACAESGCLKDKVELCVRSPLFTFESDDTDGDKDYFINYMLRTSGSRIGIKKPANAAVCESEGIPVESAERVRKRFLCGLSCLPGREATGGEYVLGIQKLLTEFAAEETLGEIAADAEQSGFSSIAAMSQRAYGETESVLAECEKLTGGEKYSAREFIRILKSGFTAAQVSLIPPKQDAVFVGDLSTCVNAGTRTLIAGGLTGGVPSSSQDTSILTDADLTSLERIKLAVSPKISLVNLRIKETVALNISSFTDRLYLTYPARSGGEEAAVSEIISYTKKLYLKGGKPLAVRSFRDISGSEEYFKYFNCRKIPAIRRVAEHVVNPAAYFSPQLSAVEEWLKGEGELGLLAPAKKANENKNIGALYGGYVSPTGLETYFSCPYRVFAERGLRLEERREGAFRPTDSGNFIHSVLQEVAKRTDKIASEEECAALAKKLATELSARPEYAFAEEDGGAGYAVNCLISEAVVLSAAMYRQIALSDFRVEGVERNCLLKLDDGMTVGGRIDRLDCCGDWVRVVDYKTGGIDDKAESYYMGLKLQLPLYLYIVSEGRKPAGGYYFPANIDYAADVPNEFTLKGFMDGSREAVMHSDVTLAEGETSKLVGVKLGGRKSDRVMESEVFSSFLKYSSYIAAEGARAMLSGEIAPSPVEGGCDYCRYKGLCGYDTELSGERERVKSSCGLIAEIALKKERGEKAAEGEGEKE